MRSPYTTPRLVALGAAALVACGDLEGCLPGGAPTPATVADLHQAEAVALEALPVACVVAVAVDPALMTAICAVVDATDAIPSPPVTVKTASPAAAVALVAAHPATAHVTATLSTLDAMWASAARSSALVGH